MTAESFIGLSVQEIDTPALVIDLDVMEGNISRMAGYFKGIDANLRPHIKTHKCPIIARKQVEAGGRGITCSKLGEVEVMIQAGFTDILIANEIVGRQKIKRLMDLAAQADLTVAVDDAGNIEDLSTAAQAAGIQLKVLVDVNVGMNRCGVDPGEPALALAKKVAASSGLTFMGLMGYEGHVVSIASADERTRKGRESMKLLIETKDLIERSGLAIHVVSSGGSGTYNISGPYPGVTEIQAGSYIFMDAPYQETGIEFGSALTLLATIVSLHLPDRIITDAGMKTITAEFGFPVVKGSKDLEVIGQNEEHGKIRTTTGKSSLKVGDKIELIPSHGCTTINLHDKYYAVRKGNVEAVYPILARGKST